MGERGLPARILAPRYGGHLTFGALAAGRESAPGQPTVAQLRDLYRLQQQQPSTQVCPATTSRFEVTDALGAAVLCLLVDEHCRRPPCSAHPAVDVCRLLCDVVGDCKGGNTSRPWCLACHHAEWTPGWSAGDVRNQLIRCMRKQCLVRVSSFACPQTGCC